MELEQLVQKSLAPFQWLDKRIQQSYNNLGQQLSSNLLYPTTFGLSTVGLFVGATEAVATIGKTTQLDPYTIATPLSIFAFDFYYNLLGVAYTIVGRPDVINPLLKKERDDSSKTPAETLPIIRICQLVNNAIRLPTMFLSMALVGKGFYESAASFFSNTSDAFSDPFLYFTAGFGVLAVASSMYLKQ